MDVEKTMEFILQQQAKTDAQLAMLGERQAKAEERQAKAEERQAKADKQIAAILKLIQTGMRMIVKQGENINQLRESHKELAQAQKVTEVELQGLIDALRRGGNGHRPKK